MKRIEVKIKEKDKGTKNLTLFNLREEIVNFLYKDTIANSTKANLQSFVLLFFISIKIKDRTILEYIFDDALPKFRKLNGLFSNKGKRIQSREYQKLVRESELTEIFRYDIFFVLIEAVSNIDEIEEQLPDIIKNNQEIAASFKIIKSKYAEGLKQDIGSFKASKIEDDRYDDNGRLHDLSKSVYRTVMMRNSRNLDLGLQKYTAIQEITSKSPIDLTFIQQIDFHIIFDMWNKYHLAEYVKTVAPHVVTAIKDHIDFKTNLGDLIPMWIMYKIGDRQNRKETRNARQAFEEAALKKSNSNVLEELTVKLVDSVLAANDRLEKEIAKNRKAIVNASNLAVKDKALIKKLEDRVDKLENLSVSTELIEDSNEES